MQKLGVHAVVLGASIGGLLAARVLADFYDQVTVVERDSLPAEPINRRGVPQGRLLHASLARCTQVLDELFPGFVAELKAAGVRSWENGDLSKVWMSSAGHCTVRSGRATNAPTILFASRPTLEWNVRRRAKMIPNVAFLEGHDVVGLTATTTGDRVTGARVVDRAANRQTALRAELVVDATGRGSRTPVFLEELGYDRPQEDELTVHLAYACQLMRITPDTVPEHLIALFPEPGRPRMFGFIQYENDTAMFGVGTIAGGEPPSRRDDMVRFAEDFAPAHVLEAFRTAEPLGEVIHHRVPSNRWRRYDKMSRTPDGLLVVGDAVCIFNPIYGQGMTVAAIEAMVLRDCLRHGDRDLPHKFFRASAKQIRVAWQTAVGSDLTLPEVAGPRPISMRITNAFLAWVLNAVEVDPVVAGQFMRITAMVDPPMRLLRPSILLRVLRAGNRKKEKGIDMSNTNVETTKKGFDAFNAGDLEAALSVFDDAAEWTVNGESMIGGTYHGKSELTELFMRLAEKGTKAEAKRILADGDDVVVLTEVTTGAETSHEADMFTYRDGKIVKARTFGDTAMQERIYGSKHVAAE